MKTLMFGPDLLSPVLQERKKITIRNYREGAHDFAEGEIVCGKFMDGLNVRLRVTADTELKPFHELTDEEAQEDGFDDAEAAFSGLLAYYPNLTKQNTAAIIRFELHLKDGETQIEKNEYAQKQ